MTLIDMIGNEFHTRVNTPLIVRNDPRDSKLMRKWWAFKEACLEWAAEFQSRARAMKRKYWWRNMKMWIILGVVAFFILIIWAVSSKTGGNPIADDDKIEPAIRKP